MLDTKKFIFLITHPLIRVVLVVYFFRHIFDSRKWTFAFIKSFSVFRTVSVVGEAGGADPTLQ